MNSTMNDNTIILVDKNCPACHQFVVHVTESTGALKQIVASEYVCLYGLNKSMLLVEMNDLRTSNDHALPLNEPKNCDLASAFRFLHDGQLSFDACSPLIWIRNAQYLLSDGLQSSLCHLADKVISCYFNDEAYLQYKIQFWAACAIKCSFSCAQERDKLIDQLLNQNSIDYSLLCDESFGFEIYRDLVLTSTQQHQLIITSFQSQCEIINSRHKVEVSTILMRNKYLMTAFNEALLGKPLTCIDKYDATEYTGVVSSIAIDSLTITTGTIFQTNQNTKFGSSISKICRFDKFNFK
jgi:hypothetical protein